MPPSGTVLIMPPWSGAAGLSSRLGPDRAQLLSELLLERTVVAAEAAAPGAVRRAGREHLAAAVEQVWPEPSADESGPLLILWPELPRWGPAHLDAALSDFAAGCELVIGPVFDGGFYLLGLARPLPGVFELEEEAWESPTAMGMTLAAAARDEVSTGLLRPERALRTPEDVAAGLADPLLDEELRGLLS